jgi:hypothetical protein
LSRIPGVGTPLWIGLGFLAFGLALLLLWRWGAPAFFRRPP